MVEKRKNRFFSCDHNTRTFPCKVYVKEVMSEQRFEKKNDFSYVIAKQPTFLRKVYIKGVMSEKRFKKNIFFM